MLGLPQLFPFVLLFALPSLGLTDEKDFLGGGSISFGPLSLFSSWSLVSFFCISIAAGLWPLQKWCEGTSHSLGRLKVFSLFLNKGLFPRFGLSDEFCISLLPLPLPLGSPSSVLLGQGSFLICFMSSSKIPFFPFVRKNFGGKILAFLCLLKDQES